jgi:hypothetical protein
MKPKVNLDEIKKSVKSFDPKVMEIIRGGGEWVNCVITCPQQNGCFRPSTCCAPAY